MERVTNFGTDLKFIGLESSFESRGVAFSGLMPAGLGVFLSGTLPQGKPRNQDLVQQLEQWLTEVQVGAVAGSGFGMAFEMPRDRFMICKCPCFSRLPIYLSIYLTIYLSIHHLFVYLSMHLPTYLYTHLSIYLSAYLILHTYMPNPQQSSWDRGDQARLTS